MATALEEFFLDVLGRSAGEFDAVLKDEASESRERDLLERSEREDFVEFCVSDRVNDGYDFNESFCFEEELPIVKLLRIYVVERAVCESV